MRHKLVHAYFQVDLDILWDTVKRDIPELIKELEKIPELVS
ncbi:MAG: HepT-like ribonuclease domain-containing protein [Candidatus Poribacteria bacterium]